MNIVNFGIVGLGGMGVEHIASLKKSPFAELKAVCDSNIKIADEQAEINNVPAFYNAKDLFDSGKIDAVIIATPHYFHTPIAVAAFDAGIHVLCEKPVAVHKADAEKMIAAHKKHPELKFAVMFQVRTSGIFEKIKSMIDNGELGNIYRVNWIVTYWFRTQKYFNTGNWRATWNGEGGGVLLNQAPHQLDLFQWMFGMPKRVRAYCSLGKYHNIEVEDDVTAYCEFDNGFSGVFITSTGEAPGTDRLEISAERGRLVLENGKITFDRAEVSVSEFLKTSAAAFGTPRITTEEIQTSGKKGVHLNIINNFAKAITDGEKIVATGEDAMNSLELANAFLYSSIKDETVELPLDSRKFDEVLNDLILKST